MIEQETIELARKAGMHLHQARYVLTLESLQNLVKLVEEKAADIIERQAQQIADLTAANKLACEGWVEEQTRRVEYAEQIEVLREALENYTIPACNCDFCQSKDYDVTEPAREALAKTGGVK